MTDAATPPHPMPGTLPYLALGDSYTIGEGVPEDGRWPLQLARALRSAGIPLADPRIIAATGWTTDELSQALDAAGPLGTFGFVSLLIGVNNQYRGRAIDDYARGFDSLLERATGFAGGDAGRVIVLSIPDWGVTPFALAQGRDAGLVAHEIDAYNAVAAGICDTRGVAFVDITPISRERGAGSVMVVDDGLHPSSTMYAAWTACALPVARALLESA